MQIADDRLRTNERCIRDEKKNLLASGTLETVRMENIFERRNDVTLHVVSTGTASDSEQLPVVVRAIVVAITQEVFT
jgi:hypothetical protein